MPTQWLCGASLETLKVMLGLHSALKRWLLLSPLEEEEIPEQRVKDLDPGLTALRFPSLPYIALSSGTSQELILSCLSRGGGYENTCLLRETWGGSIPPRGMWGKLPQSRSPLGQFPQMTRVPQKQEREP